VQEEMHEFKEAVEEGDADQIENEFGDILFSLINYARFKDIDPELALERTNKKFIKRFQYLEGEAAKAGKKLHDMTLAEMDVYWNAAKKM
jgi:XTP/dITP diphosphohydrolase